MSSEEEILITCLRRLPDAAWANGFFDTVHQLLEATGLNADSPQLVLSLPQKKRIAVTVNQRYVLAVAYPEAVIGISLANPLLLEDTPGLSKVEMFNSGSVWTLLQAPERFEIPEALRESLIKAARREMQLLEGSPQKKHDQPLLYRAVLDPVYRQGLLERAFGAPQP
ncbi:MAG: hypothetical protein ACO1RX_04340 [Candidatus Sericytochromatia bacterium]